MEDAEGLIQSSWLLPSIRRLCYLLVKTRHSKQMAAMWTRLQISSNALWRRIGSDPSTQISKWSLLSVAGYAKAPGVSSLGKKAAGKGKISATVEKKVFPVETDPVKLVNFVCGSNYLKTGKDVELKPDSEYPDWLWQLNTEKPKPLEEMDPESLEYWKRLRKLALRRQSRMMKLKKF